MASLGYNTHYLLLITSAPLNLVTGLEVVILNPIIKTYFLSGVSKHQPSISILLLRRIKKQKDGRKFTEKLTSY